MERRKNARYYDQSRVVEAIGEQSDQVADSTFEVLDRLASDEERQLFLRMCYRRLVVQALDAAGSLDLETAKKFGSDPIHRYADPDNWSYPFHSLGLTQAVVTEALGDLSRERTPFVPHSSSNGTSRD